MKLRHLALGAGVGCGALCGLPILLAALGIGGAAAVAAVAYQVDELVFCSPLTLRLALAGCACAVIAYAFRRYRRRRKRALTCCAAHEPRP